MATEAIQVVTTLDNRSKAEEMARRLLEQRLVACVQIVGGVESYFWWQGKVDSAAELLLVAKTRRSLYPRLERAIQELHPYECPEILSFTVDQGFPGYLDWLAAEVGEE